MSRVVMLNLASGEVRQACEAAKIGVSALEVLPDGGVRLVCMSRDGAEAIRRKLKSKIMKVEPRRQLVRPRTPLW